MFILLNNYYSYIVAASVSFGGLAAAATSERRVTTKEGNVKPERPIGVVSLPRGLDVPAEWRNLLNPAADEFWIEGNFKPDQGFLLWAKNPTVQNAKLYLIRMNAKRDRIHLMQKQQELANKELISQGVIANDYDFLAKLSLAAAPQSQGVLSGTHIFFLFHPSCPHCAKQAQILGGQSNVTPMQVGGNELLNFPNLPPSIWARKEDIEQYAKEKVVPILLILSNTANKMVSAKGVHTLAQIQEIVSSLNKKGSSDG